MGGRQPSRARPVSAVLKRRLVKLVVNFLFYFRTDEAEVGRRGGGSRAGGWGPRVARPFAPSAPSPLEPCCWSTAESPRKSPAASPSVSAGGGARSAMTPNSALPRPFPGTKFRAGLLPCGAGCAHPSQPLPSCHRKATRALSSLGEHSPRVNACCIYPFSVPGFVHGTPEDSSGSL